MSSELTSSGFKLVERRGKGRRRKAASAKPLRDILELVERDLHREEWFDSFHRMIVDELSPAVPMKPTSVLCLGLGSVAQFMPARFQFALLLDLCRHYQLKLEDIEVCDPAFNDDDLQLFHDMGIVRCSTEKIEDYSLLSATLLYMPHCDRHLYNNVLQDNWTLERLGRIILVGNDLRGYGLNVTTKELNDDAPCVARIAPYIRAFPLPPTFPLHVSAFNDMAIQVVNKEQLPPADDGFWTLPSLPNVAIEDKRSEQTEGG